MLEGATLDEKLEILAAIGQREDPFIGAYIDDFLGRHSAQPAQSEHLLRILLDTAFPRGAAPERLAARVEPNQAALLAAAARLATFADPQLCAAIVRVIPLLPGGRADLLGLVDRIVDRMGRSDGLLDPRENGLLLDALETMRAIGSPDFLEPVAVRRPSLAGARGGREGTGGGACARRRPVGRVRTMRGRLLLVATRALGGYCDAVADALHARHPDARDLRGALSVATFADGEMEVELGTSVRGRDVFLFAGSARNALGLPSSECKLETYHAVDALRRAQAGRISLFEPYCGPGRSDRPTRRNSVGLWMHLKTLVELGVDHYLTFQLHSEKSRTFIDPVRCAVDDLPAHALLKAHLCDTAIGTVERLQTEVQRRWVFCSVDAGGEGLAKRFAASFGTRIVIAHKQRDYSRARHGRVDHPAGERAHRGHRGLDRRRHDQHGRLDVPARARARRPRARRDQHRHRAPRVLAALARSAGRAVRPRTRAHDPRHRHGPGARTRSARRLPCLRVVPSVALRRRSRPPSERRAAALVAARTVRRPAPTSRAVPSRPPPRSQRTR